METANSGQEGGSAADPVDDAERMAAQTLEDEKTAEDKRLAAEAREKQLAEMKPLTAADILAEQPLATEWVPVPRWGGKVLVRELTGTERDRFEGSIVVQKGKQRTTNTENIRAKLCQATMVDPTDPAKKRPLFTQKQVDALGKKDAASLDLIYDVAARLSGLSDKDVEELAGNSGGAGSGGSSPS